MTVRINIEYKRELSKSLGEGHRIFGKVAPRRDYKEDEGGTGGSALLLETHPLLQEQPVGATSDLTAITTENSETLDEAIERANEACPQLSQQPVLSNAKQQSYTSVATPKLSR